MTNDQPWRQRAACIGVDPELFFPSGTSGNKQVIQAKAICARCSVTAECLAFALRMRATDGVWAATTVEERQGIKRRDNRARRRQLRKAS